MSPIGFSSSYLAKMEPRIEIFMLKLVYIENIMMFGHSGREQRRFENFVFTFHICMEFPLQ
jgi:hypothetical protein